MVLLLVEDAVGLDNFRFYVVILLLWLARLGVAALSSSFFLISFSGKKTCDDDDIIQVPTHTFAYNASSVVCPTISAAF